MLEKLIRGFSEIKNQIASHVLVFNEPERGVEFEFVFGGEYPAEEWERVFGDLKKERPDFFKSLGKIIIEANNRNQEERAEFVDSLMVPTKGILIMEGAGKKRETKKMYEQFLININSMSEFNLVNMQRAINNLKEVD